MLKNIFKNFLREDDGLTYLEYALVAALVIVVGVTVLTNLGTDISGQITAISTAVAP